MRVEPKPEKYRIDRLVEAFQWKGAEMWHPLVKKDELTGELYVLDTNASRHKVTHGCWIVVDPLYNTACVVGESYFGHIFAAVEIKRGRSLTEGMTPIERKRAGLSRTMR